MNGLGIRNFFSGLFEGLALLFLYFVIGLLVRAFR